MIVPNFVFDLALFGALFFAGVIDGMVPLTEGVVSLVAMGFFAYWAAQELAERLLRRVGWSQEALTTATTLSVGGFLYFWWRNQSDLSLLVLSIGLMMASLMFAISVIGAIGSALREGRPTPLGGWLACVGGSVALGVLAGVLALALGEVDTEIGITGKVLALAAGLALWKWREATSPPAANPHFLNAEAQRSVGAAPAAAHSRWSLLPERGGSLDRLLPLLLTGLVLLVASQQMKPPAPQVAQQQSSLAASPHPAPLRPAAPVPTP